MKGQFSLKKMAIYRDSELTFEWNQLQTAYRSKQTSELLRAMFVLKLCSYDTFVLNSMKVSSSWPLYL